jgi:hypothetical protein
MMGTSFKNFIKFFEKLFCVLAETTVEYIFPSGMISDESQMLGTAIGLHAACRWMQAS